MSGARELLEQWKSSPDHVQQVFLNVGQGVASISDKLGGDDWRLPSESVVLLQGKVRRLVPAHGETQQDNYSLCEGLGNKHATKTTLLFKQVGMNLHVFSQRQRERERENGGLGVIHGKDV